MNEPDVSGGPVRLFAKGKDGHVGFPNDFSGAGNLLFDLC